MNEDVQQLVDHPTNTWVALDVVREAFPDLGLRRIYQLARREGWRTTGTRPRQYNLADIARTYQQRKP